VKSIGILRERALATAAPGRRPLGSTGSPVLTGHAKPPPSLIVPVLSALLGGQRC